MQNQAATTGLFWPRQLLMAAGATVLTWLICHGLELGLGKSPLPPFFVTALAIGLSLGGFQFSAAGVAIAFAWVYGDFIPFVALLLALQWVLTAKVFHRWQNRHPHRKKADLLLDWQLRIQPPLVLFGAGLRVYLHYWATAPVQNPFLQDWLTGILQDTVGGLLGFSFWWTAKMIGRELKVYRRESMLVMAFCLILVWIRASDLLLGSWFQIPRLSVFIPLVLWPGLRIGPGMTTLAVALALFGQMVIQKQSPSSHPFIDPRLTVETLIGIWLFALTHILISFIWDERRSTQVALAQSEMRYKALIEHSPEAIVVLDVDTGKFSDVNTQAEHFFRLPREKLLQLGPAQLSPEKQPDGRPSSEKARELIGLAMQGQTPHFEWSHLDSEGRELPCDIRLLRLPDPERHLVRGSIVDISDRIASQRALKKSEAEVRALNQQLELRVKERTAELEAANRSLESFSYSVSHDLRAPLRSLDGFSRALEERATQLDGESREYLGRIRRASQRMAALIDDLLELARLSRREIIKENVNLSALAEEVLAQLRQGDRQRTITWVIAPGLHALADPGLTRIVLENLLGNAWKFTSKRSEAKIELLAETWEGETAFCVRDNGAGFDMTYAQKLFSPFQRLHSREEFDGNGIGLALVEKVLTRHGGRIGAYSEVGCGARFFFTLAS